ncbi:class I SAM-dependent methyltransferase [Microlunatus speluncae]|uniref:class I SAM-dependent methyltransferase n=1 Tax=Microlunatus speluncae TaxID=2594267 RepID=UPI0012662421|nr:class I SAM-dependent methyltransferase [Microlunatus speluncae]
MARYDGQADWYELNNRDRSSRNLDPLRELLGPGTGPCLDLGCGTGRYAELIKDTGRTPVGLDLSSDQLRHARPRFQGRVVLGDAQRLPFTDAVFPTVLAAWISTDVDDFGQALREIARVLVPGGVLVGFGAHPCFNGPQVAVEGQTRVIHPTYRESGWHTSAPWWGEDGIRSRFGMRHLTLADYWNAMINSGLTVDRVVEPDRGDDIPFSLGLRAHRPPLIPPDRATAHQGSDRGRDHSGAAR